jgi:K+-sensing histidine kinase KdpD
LLFLNHDGEEQRFVAMEAVGAQTLDAARARWQEAGAMILAEKMDACAQPVQSRPGDLRETVLQTVFDLNDYSDLAKAFKEQQMVVRRRLQPHPIGEDWLRSTLCMKGSSEGEYVLAPLTINGETLGFVLADRAFLDPIDIPADRLDLLQLLTSEFSLMLESIKLRREEQESKTEMEVARGVSYSLRTRAAALEARISLFAHNLGDTHEDAIAGLKRSVKFFGRAGTLASKLLRLKDIGVGKGEPIDLNSVLAEMVDAVSDPRVVLKRADSALWIQAERHYMDDLFLEVLWNACEFTAPDRGAIRMMLSREGEMAKVECIDNGQGVQPDLRQDLFKPFKCYPATRMGLGLSYVARLAEAYGGTVEEIGSWGKGAHFVVRIPLTERD